MWTSDKVAHMIEDLKSQPPQTQTELLLGFWGDWVGDLDDDAIPLLQKRLEELKANHTN